MKNNELVEVQWVSPQGSSMTSKLSNKNRNWPWRNL